MTGKTPTSPGRAAHSNGSRYAAPTGLSPVETGDAPHEVPAVLGRNAGPSGTPKQETLRPAPLSGAQPLWMPVHAFPHLAATGRRAGHWEPAPGPYLDWKRSTELHPHLRGPAPDLRAKGSLRAKPAASPGIPNQENNP